MLASIAGVRVASGCAPASASDHSPIIDNSFHARQQSAVRVVVGALPPSEASG
jgi:hypothetical protein